MHSSVSLCLACIMGAFVIAFCSPQPAYASEPYVSCEQHATFAFKLASPNVSVEEFEAFVEATKPSQKDRAIWETINQWVRQFVVANQRELTEAEATRLSAIVHAQCVTARGV